MKTLNTVCPIVPNLMRGTVGQPRKMPIKSLALKVLACPTEMGQTGQRVGQAKHAVGQVGHVGHVGQGGQVGQVNALSLGGPSEPVRPSREACQAQGCAMWISGGPDDRACAWRCIGPIYHSGESVEAAHKPRLADLDACPYGKLNTGTGLDDWPPFPPEDVDFGAYEAAGSLLDLARRYHLQVVLDGGKARIVYPPGASAALVAYGNQLLEEGLSYILNMKNQVAEAPEVFQ